MYIPPDPLGPDFLTVKIMDDFFRIPKSFCYFMVKQPTPGGKENTEQITRVNPLTTSETSGTIQPAKSQGPSNQEVPVNEPVTKKNAATKKKDEQKSKSVKNKVRPSKINEIETEDASECSSQKESTENEPPKKKIRKDKKQEKVTNNSSTPQNTNPNKPATRSTEISLQEEITQEKSPKKRKKQEVSTKKAKIKKQKKSPRRIKKCSSGDNIPDEMLNATSEVQEKNAQKSKKIVEKPSSFECETCARSFARKSQLRVHMVNHSNVRSHKCEVCQKAFKRKSELTSHMELHSGIKYTCDDCNFVTSSKISVRFHLRRTHQKDFRYKCDECGKQFMSNCQLKDHKSIHLGVKSFICEICGRSYYQKSHLSSHKRSVHGIVQRAMKKDHECKICNKHFASEYILQNHAGIHTRKFLCTYCGKEFASNSSLQLHTRMHTGERPYQCRFCSKSFVRTNALTVHELTHSGMRPYVCDLCGKSFTQRTTMMGHRKKHPGKHPPPPPTMLSKLKPTVDANV